MSGASMAGMDHGATTAKPAAQDMSGMDHSGHDMSAMQGGASMAGMDHGAGGMQAHPAGEAGNPLVDMQTMTPVPKLNDPGMGLMDNGRKVLSYAMLKSAFADPDRSEEHTSNSSH